MVSSSGWLERDKQTGGNIAISQNDNTMYCRCDRCRAIDDLEESHMGALLTLVNETADAVAKDRPCVFVGTLAYQFSRTPPRSLKPHPNVAIQLCSIEACQIHRLNDPGCPRNAAFCKDLEGWCRICEHVYVWNYNTNFACYNFPCPNLDVIGPNVRFLASHGVNGVFMQAAGNAQNDEVKRRVEKVSIAPRTVLIEPFARWVRNHQHEIILTPGSKAPPEAYSGIESELREVFRLYERYKVDHFAEWVSIPQVKATLPAGLLAG